MHKNDKQNIKQSKNLQWPVSFEQVIFGEAPTFCFRTLFSLSHGFLAHTVGKPAF